MPAFDGDDDLLPSLTITLQPNGAWTVTDAVGRLIKTGETGAEVLRPQDGLPRLVFRAVQRTPAPTSPGGARRHEAHHGLAHGLPGVDFA